MIQYHRGAEYMLTYLCSQAVFRGQEVDPFKTAGALTGIRQELNEGIVQHLALTPPLASSGMAEHS